MIRTTALILASLALVGVHCFPQGAEEEPASLSFPETEDQDELATSCYKPEECPDYHYCFFSAFTPNFCTTNLKQKAFHSTEYCLGKDQEDNNYPVHSRCQELHSEERGVTTDESPMRCYSELGYTCASAYHMPCTQNYDEDGKAIAGEEKSCPKEFSCKKQTYESGEELDVCLPNEPATRSSTCKNAFDCGFSVEEQDWSLCQSGIDSGSCLRVLQK